MRRSLSLFSPAKLNLFLQVKNKRKDGYHNLVTLFERIDLGDTISLRSNRDGLIRINCDHPDVPKGKKNLVYQVAQTLRDDFALQNGVDITITKRIPVAAGLGGGSSNAATVLLGLNRIWQLSLGRRALLSYARKIGSDVPFFLYHLNWALGLQRGDAIKRVSLRTKLWHVLVVPRVKMYSYKVYKGLNGSARFAQDASNHPEQVSHVSHTGRTRRGITTKKKAGFSPQGVSSLHLTKMNDDVNILIRALRKNDPVEAGRFLLNDLETSILQLCPNLERAKKKILALNPCGVAFSGSGPSLFAITQSRREAEALKVRLENQYRQVFVVKTF